MREKEEVTLIMDESNITIFGIPETSGGNQWEERERERERREREEREER